MKKNKISKNWIIKQHKDHFFKQSKVQGYRSRSAYKLIEINDKFKFLKKNINLLDLGCSPGGWSQVARKCINGGRILSIDKKIMEKISDVEFLQGDFTKKDILYKISNYFGKKIDVILSDMAENTSGNKKLDSDRTGELCLGAMNLSLKTLHKNGVFISKLFMGSIFEEINKRAKKNFRKVITFKPLSSRKESKEIYIYCKDILYFL